MRRVRWITRHPLQARYMLIVMASTLVPSLILTGCLYFIVLTLVAEELALPESVYSILIPVFWRINLTLLVGLPAVILLIAILALKISHRFAGPIERLEKELDEIIRGAHRRPIQVRTKDDLKGLADRINKLITMNS